MKQMMIETVSRCICMNESCGDREIPHGCTNRTIDRASGMLITYAWCESCNTLYRARRSMIGVDGLGESQIGIVTDVKERDKVLRKIRFLRGDRQQQNMSLAASA